MLIASPSRSVLLYLAARPSRRNYLITTWFGSVSGGGDTCEKPLKEWLSVPSFTRAFLKSPSSRGLSAITELLVIFLKSPPPLQIWLTRVCMNMTGGGDLVAAAPGTTRGKTSVWGTTTPPIPPRIYVPEWKVSVHSGAAWEINN